MESRVFHALAPIQEALNAYWHGVEPGWIQPSEALKVQTGAHAEGIAAALATLKARGHAAGTGKALVLGGGYAVDLRPLLEHFEQVHVVDLSNRALEALGADPRYANYRHRLRLTTMDLSGISPRWQERELDRINSCGENASSAEAMLPFLGGAADHLVPVPLEGSTYALVVSPLVTDVFSFGPATWALERTRTSSLE
ncbi:MAG TPA: hypothetical protein VEY30_05970, partial [Myxococcaceae bacterium]|nr:hypothetical protein [Myxococcaceae bacterium]